MAIEATDLINVWSYNDGLDGRRARLKDESSRLVQNSSFGFGAADCGSVRLGAAKGRPNIHIVSLIFDLLSKAWHLPFVRGCGN